MSKERPRSSSSRVCPGCGAKISARAKFCGACGAVIGAALSLELANPAARAGERRLETKAPEAGPLIDLPPEWEGVIASTAALPQGATLDLPVEAPPVDLAAPGTFAFPESVPLIEAERAVVPRPAAPARRKFGADPIVESKSYDVRGAVASDSAPMARAGTRSARAAQPAATLGHPIRPWFGLVVRLLFLAVFLGIVIGVWLSSRGGEAPGPGGSTRPAAIASEQNDASLTTGTARSAQTASHVSGAPATVVSGLAMYGMAVTWMEIDSSLPNLNRGGQA